MRKWAFHLLLSLLLTAGCTSKQKPAFTEEQLEQIPLARNTNLPMPSGGFVLAVSGETITSDEIINPALKHFSSIARNTTFEQFTLQVRPQIEQLIIAKLTNILLYRQARKDLGERIDEVLERIAEAEVRKFLVSFENDYARAEHALRQMGMDWAEFKDYQKKMILTQSYMSSKLPEQQAVTYDELRSYYDKIKDKLFITPGMLKFQLIDIEIEKLPLTDPKYTTLQQGKMLANEIMQRLKAGEDFGELARKHSHGYRRSFGGLWEPVKPDSLARPYNVLADEAKKTLPGQIAGPIEAGGHIFIMKLLEKQEEIIEPFEKVQDQLEARINLERRKRALDEFGSKLIQQATYSDRERFINFCLEKIYRMSNL
jgi:parvulin-like peptidyl-prolyl isomerase